jgi:tripartite-type tricarboxylate transporter receptor subunit TctC
MKLPHRRQFFHLAAGAAALPAVPRIARAQAYPTQPIRLVVGYPPGGPVDVAARIIAPRLSGRLGQPVIIENKPGATGNVGTETVVRAPPDGSTLLLVTPANAINATLYDKLNFNFIRDIAPVASLLTAPNIMEVNPSFPAKTVPEFIAHAKANPGKINMASSGTGSSIHLSGELFKMMAGVNMVHVPISWVGPCAHRSVGRSRATFTSLLSLSMISSGVFLGTPTSRTNRISRWRSSPTTRSLKFRPSQRQRLPFTPGGVMNGWLVPLQESGFRRSTSQNCWEDGVPAATLRSIGQESFRAGARVASMRRQFGRVADFGLGGNAGLIFLPRMRSRAMLSALSSLASGGT